MSKIQEQPEINTLSSEVKTNTEQSVKNDCGYFFVDSFGVTKELREKIKDNNPDLFNY